MGLLVFDLNKLALKVVPVGIRNLLCDLCVSLRSLRNCSREEYLTQRSQRYAEIAEKKLVC